MTCGRINVALTLPNLFGLDVVGSASVAFAGIVLMPVAVTIIGNLIGIHRKPDRNS